MTTVKEFKEWLSFSDFNDIEMAILEATEILNVYELHPDIITKIYKLAINNE
jgi:hypothetical protein